MMRGAENIDLEFPAKTISKTQTTRFLSQASQMLSRLLIKLAKTCFLLTCFFIPLSTTFTDIFFTLTAVFALLSGNVWRHRFKLLQIPVVKVLLIALLVVLLGFTYTIAPLSQAVLYSKKYLWLLLTPLLFSLKMDERFKLCAIYSFLAAMLLTLLFSYLTYFNLINFFFVKTTDGIFKDHIIQNFLMSITLLICLLKTREQGWQSIIYYLIVLFAAIDILFLCQGRIGYILLPILVLYSWVSLYGWRKLYWPCVGLLLFMVVACLFSSMLQQRLLVTEQNILNYDFLSLNHSHTSLGIRWTMWHLGLKLIAAHPVLGYGTGSIYTILAKIPDAWIIENEWIRSVNTFESAYLHVGIQFGLLGLWLLLTAMIYLWRQILTISDSYYQALIKGFMIAMMVGFFFNPWLESTTEKHLFALFLVLCFQ